MSFDTRRRYSTASTHDAPPPASGPYAAEEELLGGIAAELEAMGERATIRRTRGGQPFLCAAGAVSRLNEEITTARKGDRVCALWTWGDELPDDLHEAAAAIRRVINPEL
ncbi:hypothetical protein [Actinomadura rubrisoli]|uniref:Uncharacterized protein n=1 Tax=Actinomadura rubrisoli TaxID=2530368 RepID=A0A4R5C7R6_9ACTN|nr:hypothetical protein [Actinomadura rubrisoli]TDD93012.1 hypothetical protein E1298_10375 [Actinomadura rubrisoli]